MANKARFYKVVKQDIHEETKSIYPAQRGSDLKEEIPNPHTKTSIDFFEWLDVSLGVSHQYDEIYFYTKIPDTNEIIEINRESIGFDYLYNQFKEKYDNLMMEIENRNRYYPDENN